MEDSGAKRGVFVYAQLVGMGRAAKPQSPVSMEHAGAGCVVSEEGTEIERRVLPELRVTEARNVAGLRRCGMKQPDMVPDAGTILRVTHLGSTSGMLIATKHLDCRRAGEKVTMRGWVPGHGGDVWFVQHDNGDIAVYSFTELEVVDVVEDFVERVQGQKV